MQTPSLGLPGKSLSGDTTGCSPLLHSSTHPPPHSALLSLTVFFPKLLQRGALRVGNLLLPEKAWETAAAFSFLADLPGQHVSRPHQPSGLGG